MLTLNARISSAFSLIELINFFTLGHFTSHNHIIVYEGLAYESTTLIFFYHDKFPFDILGNAIWFGYLIKKLKFNSMIDIRQKACELKINF